MNPTNRPHDQAGAHDALFDQIERELAALATAPLHDDAATPRHCVDEFANDFLNWSMPPRRIAAPRWRTGTRTAR